MPTFEQAGIKRLASGQWLGAFVPQGTQPAVVARLTAEIGKAVAELAIKKNLEDTAQEPIGGTVADFARLVREDFAKFEKLVR